MVSRKTVSGSRSESCRPISSAIRCAGAVTVRAATSAPTGATVSLFSPSEAKSSVAGLAAGPLVIRTRRTSGGPSGSRSIRSLTEPWGAWNRKAISTFSWILPAW